MIRIARGDWFAVDYDKGRGMYRVSIFEDDHYQDELWFDAYEEKEIGGILPMAMLLKNAKDIDALLAAIEKCKGDVMLLSIDRTEEFNLKSTLSKYVGISRLCEERGDQYEIFCANHSDEAYLLQFFHELRKEHA